MNALAWLWNAIRGWVFAAVAVAAALGGAWLAGRRRGTAAAQPRIEATEQQAAAAEEILHQVEVRREADIAVAALPDAPAQSVALADPATAAGRLRDEGWIRD